ncbi:MAG TPA: phosphopantetheine-binding protein [Myxococcota bacterium]|nr:phosphopantetheine-binding protein [Myxococcota bacterium]
MSREEIRALVLTQLGRIAPEADLAALPDSALLREELELDSMDFLHFATALHDALGVDIPESDYEHIASLRGCVDYLSARKAR